MAANILQWNCNGCKTHYPELKSLMLENSPLVVCLQETHLKPGENFNLRGYNCVRKDIVPHLRARGGTAIFTKYNIPTKEIHIQSELQVVAVQVEYPCKITICNIYLPEFDWNINDLTNIVSQLPTPYLIIGDFNAHNPLWGSNRIDPRGRIIEQFIDDVDAVLLNTGEGTYLNSRSNNFSAIDLTMCSPQLATRLSWNPLNEHFFTDHCPIRIEILTEKITTNYSNKKWRLQQANWTSYSDHLQLPLPEEDVNISVEKFTKAILNTANQYIPMSDGYRPRKCVPWWNEEIRIAIQNKKRALNIFKRHPTNENMIRFKQARAKARRSIDSSKRNSWHEYISSIKTDTPTSEIWNKIKKVSGKNFLEPTAVLMENDQLIREAKEIPDVFGRYFQNISSDDNCDPTFLRIKHGLERELDFSENITSPYNVPFSMEEIENALTEVKKSSPGPDSIPYDFIIHMSRSEKEKLLSLYNQIWIEGKYPESWRQAVIIPILKPGKDPKKPSSYRPISLTCCLSKIMEKMINLRLVWYLENKNLLANCQMGFRKYRSTQDHLVYLENYIQNSFANRSHVVAVSFDLEKAYDLT